MSINNNITDIIDDGTYIDIINKILDEGKNYGKSNYGNNKKVNIEYGSVGNIATIYGDTLSRIISFMGYDVTREYFVEDDTIDINKIKNDLDRFRVNFDTFTTKKSLYDNGIVDMTLRLFQKSDKCYISNDSLYLKTSDLFDTCDRLLVNNEGTYTDLVTNISYHIDRFNRGNNILIDIVKKDKRETINALKSGIEIAGYTSSKIGFMNIDNDISEEILDDINVNVLRYYFLSKLDFDIANERMNYIDSINVKICKVIRTKTNIIDKKSGTIDNDTAYTILNKLIEFVKMVKESSSGRVDIMCDYLYDLVSLFDKYYDEEELLDYKLIEAIKIVINNTANLIGLILREEI